VTAMRGFCKELSERQKVEIESAHDDIPSRMPQQISICLFRVLQEALQNAVKHSGARRFDVELRYSSHAIDLTVRDLGSGFDVQQAMSSRGLGLISMEERLKLVDGQFSIDPRPQLGTKIRAHVPLSKVARASA
jgi:signal transduction histidine kinase